MDKWVGALAGDSLTHLGRVAQSANLPRVTFDHSDLPGIQELSKRRQFETQGQLKPKRTCGRTLTEGCSPYTHWIKDHRFSILVRVLPFTFCESCEAKLRGEPIPATVIPSRLDNVPKLISKPPGILARSSISSGDDAMIGEAPSAIVAFADCVVTTLFVILLDHQRVVQTNVSNRT